MGAPTISQKNIYNIPSCASQNLTPNLSSLQYRVVTFKSACNHSLRASPMKKKTAFTRDYLKLKDAICFLGWKEKISPRKRDSCSFCVRESSQAIKNISYILTPFLEYPLFPFPVPCQKVNQCISTINQTQNCKMSKLSNIILPQFYNLYKIYHEI